MVSRLKTKNCKVCKKPFKQFNSLQVACGVACALKLAHKQHSESYHQETVKLKREFNANDRQFQTKAAQTAFNAYIRARDKALGLGCISCGIMTGQMHAGHYITIGHGGNGLRFDPTNCHLQCAQCNNFKSGNLARYRIALTQRIGLKEVERLEATKDPVKLSIEDIKAIRQEYKNKLLTLA
jgi:5-methylcytosine-specific restriction endonuclease McrA